MEPNALNVVIFDLKNSQEVGVTVTLLGEESHQLKRVNRHRWQATGKESVYLHRAASSSLCIPAPCATSAWPWSVHQRLALLCVL